jgi:CBS domain-containing protein
MSTISNILEKYDHAIPFVSPNATVQEAAKLMNQFKVGALVVCESDSCVGIFTERDLLRCFALSPHKLPSTSVADVMTRELFKCAPQTDIVEARRIMVSKGIRNLPVIDDSNNLVGLVSLIDLDAHDLSDQQIENEYLKNYIYDRH